MKLIAYFDGCCYPNPEGVATAGVFIKDGRKTLLKEGFQVGIDCVTSCNVAEYEGLIRALQFLKQKGFTDRKIIIRGDSNLVINQMSGKWRIRDGLYTGFAIKAKSLAKEFSDLIFEWVSRDKNTICDTLATEALRVIARRHILETNNVSE